MLTCLGVVKFCTGFKGSSRSFTTYDDGKSSLCKTTVIDTIGIPKTIVGEKTVSPVEVFSYGPCPIKIT